MSVVHDRRPTILLVEDNPDEELLVMRALRRASIPCQILVAHSTEEALEFLFARNAFSGRGSGNPDVIITDLRINSIGGADLVSEIRNRQETRLIPIVVLTGSASTTQIDDLYRRGANSFLEKPTDFEEFATMVTRLAIYWGLLNRSATATRQVANFPYPL